MSVRKNKLPSRVPRSLLTTKPPQFESDFSSRKKLRFISLTAGATSVTRGNLLNTVFINAAAGATNYRLIQAIRINRVSIWSIGTSTTPTQTISLDWVSTEGPSLSYSDTSMGVSQAAYLTSVPPSRSLAGFWSLSSFNESDALMVLTTNINDIVDVDVSVVWQNNQPSGFAPVTVTTTASGSAGVMYGGYLDGQTGSKVYKPIGLVPLL
jgi:hypothetical protein